MYNVSIELKCSCYQQQGVCLKMSMSENKSRLHRVILEYALLVCMFSLKKATYGLGHISYFSEKSKNVSGLSHAYLNPKSDV